MEEIFGQVPTRAASVFTLNFDSELQFRHFAANAKAQGGGSRPIPCAFSDLRAVFPLSRLLPRAVISPHIHPIDLRRTVGTNISGSPYATSPASSFAISPRSGSINSSNSSLFSISRSDTNGTVEKQYTPHSKSLYARSVMRSRSAISACVKPRFSRRERAYSDRYRLITDLYSSTSKDLRFRQILCHKQHNKLLESILP